MGLKISGKVPLEEWVQSLMVKVYIFQDFFRDLLYPTSSITHVHGIFILHYIHIFRYQKWLLREGLVLSRVDGQGFLGNSAPANNIIVNFVIDQQNKKLRKIAIVVSPGSSYINVIVFIFMYANVFVFVKRRWPTWLLRPIPCSNLGKNYIRSTFWIIYPKELYLKDLTDQPIQKWPQNNFEPNSAQWRCDHRRFRIILAVRLLKLSQLLVDCPTR